MRLGFAMETNTEIIHTKINMKPIQRAILIYITLIFGVITITIYLSCVHLIEFDKYG